MSKVNITSKKLRWTHHAQEKMAYYQLSANRLKRVLRHPARIETGVAVNTIACLQSAGSKKHPYEIWLMYQIKGDLLNIISAWRYPGITKAGDKVPIPPDILAALNFNTF